MKTKFKIDRTQAFTLVELLVVITILVLLAAIAIPQLRAVNKERNIRETARVVASLFSQASQRAQNDGVAGVLMRRNPNFVALGGYGYAVTEMSLLRRVPDYTGDNSTRAPMTSFGAGATSYTDAGGTLVPYSVRIPKPIDQDDVQVIQVQDLISFNNSSAQYQITAINEVTPAVGESPPNAVPFLDLTLNNAGLPTVPGDATTATNLPDPSGSIPAYTFTAGPAPFATGIPFVVQRSPRILKSSTLTLPDGYIVDLRFSGFSMSDSGFEGKTAIGDPDVLRAGAMPLITNVLEPFPRTIEMTGSGAAVFVDYANADVGVLFNASGSVDQIYMRQVYDFNENGIVPGDGNTEFVGGAGDRVSTYSRLALESLYLFVTEQEEDQTLNPLSVDTNLWVSISNNTGVTNVGYNVPSNVSLGELAALYNGPGNVATATDRGLFNTEIINARNLTNLGSAAQ